MWGRVRCGGMSEKEHLRWFGHIERMENEEFVKKVYGNSVEGSSRRGRPLSRWEDRVKEYVSERGVRGNRMEQAGRECVDRERWGSICRSHPPWSEASELLIDYSNL